MISPLVLIESQEERMKRFQKIQLFSSVVPRVSVLFVVSVTVLYCYKVRKYYFELIMKCILYILVYSSLWNWMLTFNILWLPYVAIIPVEFLLNYLLILLQIKCISKNENS